jgi:SHS2 domain-containing protein
MFRFLDHPSEAYIEIVARTVEEVFRDAATALFELMTDTSALKEEMEFTIELEAPDRRLLFIDWLNRLILLHEMEHIFFCGFNVTVSEDPLAKLTAMVRGERIKQNQERRAQVKSVTYGQFEWMETEQGHLVRFLVDI